jgi:hypothetical protein
MFRPWSLRDRLEQTGQRRFRLGGWRYSGRGPAATGDDEPRRHGDQKELSTAAENWFRLGPAEKVIVRESEPERSCVTTGTLVQQNRQDASDYQVNTKSSSTQIPSELNYLPSGEPNSEPEVASDEWVAGGPELGYFAARNARMQALREAAAEKPARYRSRFLD